MKTLFLYFGGLLFGGIFFLAVVGAVHLVDAASQQTDKKPDNFDWLADYAPLPEVKCIMDSLQSGEGWTVRPSDYQAVLEHRGAGLRLEHYHSIFSVYRNGAALELAERDRNALKWAFECHQRERGRKQLAEAVKALECKE